MAPGWGVNGEGAGGGGSMHLVGHGRRPTHPWVPFVGVISAGRVGRHPFSREAQGSQGPSRQQSLPPALRFRGAGANAWPATPSICCSQARPSTTGAGGGPSPAVEGRPFSCGLSWAE